MELRSKGLSDDALLQAVRDCDYPIGDFRHLDHLRLGWILLHRMDAASAADEAATLIRSLGLHHGKGHAYHETITRAWMWLLATHDEHSFEEFLSQNQNRISKGLLNEFWSSEVLDSVEARSSWVDPDVRPLPSAKRRDAFERPPAAIPS